MSDIYKLQYNGMTLAYPGWNGYVSWENAEVAYNLYLQQQIGGTITADKLSGMNGEIVTLGNTPSAGYQFNSYGITGAELSGNQFAFNGSDVSAEANFEEAVYTLTLQNDGHGTIAATETTGHAGDTVTLSNTYNTYYRFNNYTVTGGTINGSTFTFGTQNATAKANFKVNSFTARGNMKWKDVFTGTYQGSRDAYPALQITAWTGTQASSTMTGGLATSYGASGTTKASCFNGSTKCWKSIADWQSTSLKAPVNVSAWKFSGTMTVAGKHNQGGVYGTEAAARAMTACANVNGTSTARTYTSAAGWITSNGQGTTTGSFTVTATAAKCGTATNQGSYVPGFTLYNYGTITVGSGGFNSWAHNKVTAFSGPWYASGILP